MTEITVQNITEGDLVEIFKKEILVNIETVKSEYMSLTVSGVEDKKGYEKIHKALMAAVHTRTSIDKTEKQLGVEARVYLGKIKRVADTMRNIVAPIETYLKNQKDIVDTEKKRLEYEAKQRETEKNQLRQDSFLDLGVKKTFHEVTAMSDSEFDTEIAKATETYLAEQKRLADEAARLRAEEEAARLKAEEEKKEHEALRAKLKAQQQEIEQQKREVAEAQAKIAAENARIKAAHDAAAKKIDDDRRALELERQKELHRIENEKRIEQAKKEAAEKALKDAAEQAKKEAKEKAEAEARAKEEEAKKEELRPDKQKLKGFLNLFNNFVPPELKSDGAKAVLGIFHIKLENLLIDTEAKVEAL